MVLSFSSIFCGKREISEAFSGRSIIDRRSEKYILKLTNSIQGTLQFFTVIFPNTQLLEKVHVKRKELWETFSPLPTGWTLCMMKFNRKESQNKLKGMHIWLYHNCELELHIEIRRMKSGDYTFIFKCLRIALLWIKKAVHLTLATKPPLQIWSTNSYT